ncbi:MAG: hypothetical protein OHK0022_03180 [Roseiflexaceae bacterium]
MQPDNQLAATHPWVARRCRGRRNQQYNQQGQQQRNALVHGVWFVVDAGTLAPAQDTLAHYSTPTRSERKGL